MTALTTFNMDQMNVFGLDPVVVLGLITAGSGGVGWLLGPFLGNAVFGMAHRRVGAQIAEVSFCSGFFLFFFVVWRLRCGGFLVRFEGGGNGMDC